MTDVRNRGDRQQALNAAKKMEDNDFYFEYAPILWDALSSGEREVLNQLLHTGPVYDGSIISKSHRDSLFEYGLATRVCFMGEDGYSAATYRALTVFKAGKAVPFERRPGVRG